MKFLIKKIPVFLVIALCLSSVSVFALDWALSNNYGEIKRLYVTDGIGTRDDLLFRLKNGQTAMNPVDEYYAISHTNPNYQAMADVLYMAAENNWVIKVRTEEILDVNGHAAVIYLVVDR